MTVVLTDGGSQSAALATVFVAVAGWLKPARGGGGPTDMDSTSAATIKALPRGAPGLRGARRGGPRPPNARRGVDRDEHGEGADRHAGGHAPAQDGGDPVRAGQRTEADSQEQERGHSEEDPRRPLPDGAHGPSAFSSPVASGPCRPAACRGSCRSASS